MFHWDWFEFKINLLLIHKIPTKKQQFWWQLIKRDKKMKSVHKLKDNEVILYIDRPGINAHDLLGLDIWAPNFISIFVTILLMLLNEINK